MLIVSSAVGVDADNRTITRTVVGPAQPSTLTWTRFARIEARLACNVFLPNEISVIRPGLSFAEIDGLTDADPPTVTPGTPLIVTFAFGPTDEPNPNVAPSLTSTWHPDNQKLLEDRGLHRLGRLTPLRRGDQGTDPRRLNRPGSDGDLV
ncbi:Uncharacterised protein [Gordonia paraffinivorans]|uniref:Uncharacterized protein n=1 Tax=Gordonia paraffinivorans TaxID=175628 RepID=A0ABD7V760_9ACTN|nr:Uncharacterised protein [Gordonia paraffinivorans]